VNRVVTVVSSVVIVGGLSAAWQDFCAEASLQSTIANRQSAIDNRQPVLDPQQGQASAINPHWRADGCEQCHTVQDDSVARIEPAELDLRCLGCHDGRKASREAHPIGRAFQSPQVRKPDGWPAPGDRLSCLTCHDMIRACNAAAVRPAHNSAMLRRPLGADRTAFCATCHVSELHQRFHVHAMLDEAGNRQYDKCLRCHEGRMLETAREHRSGDPALIAEEITLCGSCHRRHLDFFSPGHIGIRPSPKVVATMLGTDASAGRTPQAERPVLLPLSADGRVVCSTCHNPHPNGVFTEESELAYGAMAMGQTGSDRLGLRGAPGNFCGGCHGP
jgi:hypothetical protein